MRETVIIERIRRGNVKPCVFPRSRLRFCPQHTGSKTAPRRAQVLLCIFEVSEVCESDAMDQYLACAHQWSLYAPDAAADPEWNNVTHTGARDTWVCPTVCSTWTPAGADSQYCGEASDAGADSYDFSGRCARDPTYRGELENRDDRVASCEVISILYDMALGAVLAALLFGFAYATNSYRALAEESGPSSPQKNTRLGACSAQS